jgi:hypothetical protein
LGPACSTRSTTTTGTGSAHERGCIWSERSIPPSPAARCMIRRAPIPRASGSQPLVIGRPFVLVGRSQSWVLPRQSGSVPPAPPRVSWPG